VADSEQQRLRRLLELFADTEQWVRRVRDADVERVEPQAGSPLAGAASPDKGGPPARFSFLRSG
jgi:hypothetical protein